MVSVCTEQLESFRYFRHFGDPPHTKIEFQNLIVVTDAEAREIGSPFSIALIARRRTERSGTRRPCCQLAGGWYRMWSAKWSQIDRTGRSSFKRAITRRTPRGVAPTPLGPKPSLNGY